MGFILLLSALVLGAYGALNVASPRRAYSALVLAVILILGGMAAKFAAYEPPDYKDPWMKITVLRVGIHDQKFKTLCDALTFAQTLSFKDRLLSKIFLDGNQGYSGLDIPALTVKAGSHCVRTQTGGARERLTNEWRAEA